MTEVQLLEETARERRVGVRQVTSFVIALAVAFSLLTVGLSLGLPYAPTTVDVYEIVPDVVCPG